jgi:ribonuclease HII
VSDMIGDRFLFYFFIVEIFLCHTSHSLSIRKGRYQSYSLEQSLIDRGYEHVIGVDEVGRGAIAGPVLAVACCISKNGHDLIEGVTDSKILSSDERQNISRQVLDQPEIYKWQSAQRSSQDIARSNILKATMQCFRECIEEIVVSENFSLDQTYAIVDGKSTPKLTDTRAPIPCRPFVGADLKVYSVSIASIIAKELRDAIMMEMNDLYPEYKFHENKGYQTREHIEAIGKYGPSPIHRMSFKALKHL